MCGKSEEQPAVHRSGNRSNSFRFSNLNAGKAKMRNNALRHGLTSKHAVIAGEDPEEYKALRQELVAE